MKVEIRIVSPLATSREYSPIAMLGGALYGLEKVICLDVFSTGTVSGLTFLVLKLLMMGFFVDLGLEEAAVTVLAGIVSYDGIFMEPYVYFPRPRLVHHSPPSPPTTPSLCLKDP